MSLRRRLLVGFAFVAFALVVGGYVLANTMRTALVDRVDKQLAAVSGQVDRRRPEGSRSEFVISVFDLDGNLVRIEGPLVAGDEPLPDTAEMARVAQRTRPDHDAFATVSRADGDGPGYRVRATSAVDQFTRRQYVVVIAQSLHDVDHTFGQIVVRELITAAVVLAALAVVAYWVLRQGLRPLAEITDAADAIAAGDLSRRVSHPAGSTEAGRVGVAFNRMLSQIEDDIEQRQAAQRRLKQFVADASHELRTPLTSIRGYADLWRQGGLTDPTSLDDAMGRIERESARMGRLVDDLLLLARLDEGIPLRQVPVDLSQIARDVVADAHVVDPSRPITLNVNESVIVIGDDDRLRQAVANLVSNARSHTPASVRIDVSVAEVDGEAKVVVSDNGPGMDDETASRVFERFFRADRSRSRSQGGSGLGLSIVSAVAGALGGQVTVETAPGAGAVFSIALPLITAPDASLRSTEVNSSEAGSDRST